MDSRDEQADNLNKSARADEREFLELQASLDEVQPRTNQQLEDAEKNASIK